MTTPPDTPEPTAESIRAALPVARTLTQWKHDEVQAARAIARAIDADVRAERERWTDAARSHDEVTGYDHGALIRARVATQHTTEGNVDVPCRGECGEGCRICWPAPEVARAACAVAEYLADMPTCPLCGLNDHHEPGAVCDLLTRALRTAEGE